MTIYHYYVSYIIVVMTRHREGSSQSHILFTERYSALNLYIGQWLSSGNLLSKTGILTWHGA